MNGTVESITTDWRGDTLALGVGVAEYEFAVGDISDFDEDGGWLTIGDSEPLEYVSTDDAAVPVVTLATPLGVGVAFAAGEPVVVWDPTVQPAGAHVVEYVASVMTDGGAVPATIPHAVVPLAGVDRLIGASVSLDEESDGDWYVAQVYGRESTIDQSYVDTPYVYLYQATDVLWIDTGSTFAPMTDWDIQSESEGDFTYNGATGEVTFLKDGRYLILVAVNWSGNSSGRRYIRLVVVTAGVDTVLRTIGGAPPDSNAFTQQIQRAPLITAGQKVRIDARQTSGLDLQVNGDAAGAFTGVEIVRLQA